MPKQVAVILLQNDWATFKEMVPPKSRTKVLEAYLFQSYQLPDDLSTLIKKRTPGIIRDNLRLSEEALSLIDTYVQIVDVAEERSTNRSAIIRAVIKGYIQSNSNRNIHTSSHVKKHATYYFERGTREILDNFIGHRHRSSAIEHFILSETLDYGLLNNLTLKNNTPIDSESIRINLNSAAIDIIDNFVELHQGKVSASAVMREVVCQLIQNVSGKPFVELLLSKKLKSAVDQYSGIVGYTKVEEIVSDYLYENKSREPK